MTDRLPRPFRAALAAVTALVTLGACGSDEVADTPSDPARDSYAASLGVTLSEFTQRNPALYVQDVVVGTGAEAVAGRTIRADYTGWLPNGNRFDTSVGRGPFTFTLGVGQVIPGWDQGIAGMKVGGKRRLLIGSALGYGPTGSGPIPPNSTLVFEVDLIAVQ
jgi:FKBP-type peptidyl-prolyl cis-trans isomerase